jgi:hypothetical protein
VKGLFNGESLVAGFQESWDEWKWQIGILVTSSTANTNVNDFGIIQDWSQV